MSNEAQYHKPGLVLDHTPSAAVTGGQTVEIAAIGGGVAANDIAADATDSLLIQGVAKIVATSAIGNVGDNVWWDDNGTPYGGAATGAATTAVTAGDYWLGTLVAAKGDTDTHAYVALNQPSQIPAWHDKAHVGTAIDLTWAAATHNGKVIHVTADAKTVTMPVGVAGMEAIIQNDVANAGAKVSVDFDGNETLEGNLAIAATKTADLTKTTSIRGDYLHIRCETAASLWVCLAKRGTWVTSA